MSVCLYRMGISCFSLSLLALSTILSGLFTHLSEYYSITLLVICISAALTAANLHVYSKHVRAVICWSAWIGILLMLSDASQSRVWLSLGFLFITFSGIALKESFCFKVLGLKLVPVLLALSTFSLWLEQPWGGSVLLALAGLVMGNLSIAKWRMPLHFDIGNKANYEI
ncbi:DUF2301 domain-containing membrane protein [Vibrio scophthalmi]|uniref:DUF2301 domain-containing membrane protein n=1 Tax=Vibrio scophthalmi TaxID=45658 RepID=UPI001F4A09CF|nr:DUF2301 domain-containing membrane protein [Vibrio scophthalmi]